MSKIHGGRRAVVILGPRQAGKTTLMRQLAEDILKEGFPAGRLTYFDFSDDRIIGKVTPREIIDTVAPAQNTTIPRIVLFDEIGASGNWGPWLKQAVDNKNLRIVVTDSAASMIRNSGRESGQGRWDEYVMEPLAFPEYLQLRGINIHELSSAVPDPYEFYLTNGGFPEHITNPRYQEVWRRLRSDIADRAILRDLSREKVDIHRVRDLFVYLVQNSGAVFDAVSRARDLDADARSVRDWIQLLKNTLLIHELPNFRTHASAILRPRPKIYAADHSMIYACAITTDPLSDPDTRGRVHECIVYSHLRELSRKSGGEIYYFRSKDGLKCDFVFRDEKQLITIEVTASSKPDAGKLNTTRTAAAALKATKQLLIHSGVTVEKRGSLVCAPLRRFIMNPESFLHGDPA